MSAYQEIREICCAANRRLPELGIVDLTFGNVSVADRSAGVFAIKPSGVDYAELRPEDIVVLLIESEAGDGVVEGNLRPSSDTPTHRRLLQAFSNAGAVVHTHSRHAVAWAQAGRDLPCMGTTHADYFAGSVPVTRIMTPEEVEQDYEWNTAEVIVERFRLAGLNPDEVPAVLVRGHGPFVWGPNAKKAVENAYALEVIAEMTLKARMLAPVESTLPSHVHKKHFSRKHGPRAYYGQA